MMKLKKIYGGGGRPWHL